MTGTGRRTAEGGGVMQTPTGTGTGTETTTGTGRDPTSATGSAARGQTAESCTVNAGCWVTTHHRTCMVLTASLDGWSGTPIVDQRP